IPIQPVYIAPRNPMVLCHGLYGFDVKGPEKLPMLQVHYWRGIREALEAIGARVMVAKVSGTGGVRERAQQLDAQLASRLEAEKVNILGHSMGGLDARYLITHINPKSYSVASLTTVCTPHRGSPFMDWCRDYLSLGYRADGGIEPGDRRLQEFAQFLTRILGENASVGETSQLSRLARTSAMSDDYLSRSIALLRMAYRRIMAALDTPAYACLTTDYCQRFFNPSTPNVNGVEYLSIGAYMDPTDISGKVNPLIIPHDIIYKAEGPNDGFVSLTSAQWGHFLGSVCADHFDFTNRWRLSSMGRDFIASGPRFDPIDFYLRVGTILYQRGY
ncbi:alpha/beta-hydrolase, partial [Coemansia reversa NRRL 1564]